MQVVSFSFHRFGPVSRRLWVLGQMGAARVTLPRVPGIGFWKLLGSGSGVGFTPRPNTAVWAIMATWPDLETARRQTETAAPFRAWRKRAEETWTVFLTPVAARGEWSGEHPFVPSAPRAPGPLAALTRATVRPRVALRFWGAVPDISGMVGADPNVVFKIGLGEVPLVQQVTFSIWPDARTMSEFARTPGGPHSDAIKAVRDGGWFKEELYARFRILGDSGHWQGQSPLDRLNLENAA